MAGQAARQGRSILAAWFILLLMAFVCPPGHAEEGETAEPSGAPQDIAVAYAGRIAGDTNSTRLFLDFDKKLDAAGVQAPALVFIKSDPKDRHRDLVTNSPALDDPILRARAGAANRTRELVTKHSDREFWFYDAQRDFLVRLPTAAAYEKIQQAP
jgi:hypothetical protein